MRPALPTDDPHPVLRADRERRTVSQLLRLLQRNALAARVERQPRETRRISWSARMMAVVESQELTSLVDAFVERVNTRRRHRLLLKQVPPFLRQPSSDENDDDGVSTDWRIVRVDNAASTASLEDRIGKSFPPSFRNLIARYCFPAFECGPLFLFGNTGENTLWELSSTLFHDPHMSPVLLKEGYIQIGNPHEYNYDPICFAAMSSSGEPPLVQLDHEMTLQFGKIRAVKTVAPSFVHLLKGLVHGREMSEPIG